MKLLSLIILLLLISSLGNAQSIDSEHTVIICPAHDGVLVLPDFTETDCVTTVAGKIDPQYKHIWVKIKLGISAQLIDQALPLGLYIMGKTSSLNIS